MTQTRRPLLFVFALSPLLFLLLAGSGHSIESGAVEESAVAETNSSAQGEAGNCAENAQVVATAVAKNFGFGGGGGGGAADGEEKYAMDDGEGEILDEIEGEGEGEDSEDEDDEEEEDSEDSEDGSEDGEEDSKVGEEDSEVGEEDSEDGEEGSEESSSDDDDDEKENEIDLGVTQVLDEKSSHLRSKFDAYLAHMQWYVKHEVAGAENDEELAAVLPRCKNRRKKCVQWAMEGDCETDTAYMHSKCAPACAACDMLIYERRCPYDPKLPPAWRRGGLNAMFERIVSDDAYAKYEPRVWSRPTLAEGDEEGKVQYQVGGPWIITMENVFTEEETDRIIELGDEDGFERSDDEGEYAEDGSFVAVFTEGRTSYNAWCRDCNNDRHGGAVLGKIEDITHIPQKHFANLQILRYETTQKYELHHDFDEYSVPRQPGPRIMTFFLYLSDVEEGGGTDFPQLNLTFTPKRGRVLLWPNVLDQNPYREDERTEHQALPVLNGTKYAANAWIHQHDWQGPYSKDCDS